MTALPGAGGSGPQSSRPSTAPPQPVGIPPDQDRALARQQQHETFRIIKEMSDILHTGLDTQSLGCCLRLCEDGVNPVALAHFIKDWKTQQPTKP